MLKRRTTRVLACAALCQGHDRLAAPKTRTRRDGPVSPMTPPLRPTPTRAGTWTSIGCASGS